MNRQLQCSVYGLASAVALLAPLGSRVRAQETPKTANRFCDSIGINTHLGTGGTPYTADFYDNVQVPLAWLGVRHIRDYMAVDYPLPNDVLKRFIALGAQGVKCDLVIDPIWTHYAGQAPMEAQGITNSYLLGCQEAVEGANEWDLFSQNADQDPSTDPNHWQQVFSDETSGIWTYYRGNSSTAGMQVYSGTVVDLYNVNGTVATSPDTANYVAAHGSVSGKVDCGNCHVYNYSKGPNNNDPEENMSASIFGPTSTNSQGSSQLWGGNGPFVITETGYFTGTAKFSVSPIVQEKYTLRTLFSAFNLGAYRTYLFELCDLGTDTTDQEKNFGLIYNNGTNKPAYTALECLIGLLGDSSTSTAVTPLTWSLGGNTTNVKHTLLQKSDGSYYLALWLGVASGDPTISQGVTVTVPPTIASGTLYAINQYGSMYSNPVTITNGQMSLNVTDSVSLLKLTGPIVESTPLAMNQTSVSRNGGAVTATVTFQNVNSTAMTILPYIAARDGVGNNVDFGSGGNGDVTLSPGQTVSVSVTKTLATWMNTGTWSVSASYRTASDGHWYGLSPTLPLSVTN